VQGTEACSHEVGNAMGINTRATFVGSDQQAVIDRDFVRQENELQSVLKTLRGVSRRAAGCIGWNRT